MDFRQPGLEHAIFVAASCDELCNDSNNRRFRHWQSYEIVYRANSPGVAYVDDGSNEVPVYAELMLRVTTDHSPKNPVNGFVFGANPNTCDIVLPPAKTPDGIIHDRQFAIVFRKGRVIVQALTPHGVTILSNEGLGGQWQPVNFKSVRHFRGQMKIHLPGYQFWLYGGVEEFPRKPAYLETFAKYCENIESAAPYDQRQLKRIQGAPSTVMADSNDYEPKEAITPSVWRVKLRGTSSVFVAKKIRPGSKEQRILCGLVHGTVVRLEDVALIMNEPFLIMQPLQDNLENCMKPNDRSHITRAVTFQVLHALEYLVERGITHRNVRLSTVLVAAHVPEHWIMVKLAGFDLAVDQVEGIEDRVRDIKEECRAPEIAKGPYNSKVDIWALGNLVLRLTGRNCPSQVQDLPKDTRAFIGLLLKKNPAQRPTATAALIHPFISREERGERNRIYVPCTCPHRPDTLSRDDGYVADTVIPPARSLVAPSLSDTLPHSPGTSVPTSLPDTLPWANDRVANTVMPSGRSLVTSSLPGTLPGDNSPTASRSNAPSPSTISTKEPYQMLQWGKVCIRYNRNSINATQLFRALTQCTDSVWQVLQLEGTGLDRSCVTKTERGRHGGTYITYDYAERLLEYNGFDVRILTKFQSIV